MTKKIVLAIVCGAVCGALGVCSGIWTEFSVVFSSFSAGVAALGTIISGYTVPDA